jgi:[acyl-carrier-protein] S-malonyltransferase
MGQALAASSSAATDVWSVADEALGEAISTLAFDGPDEQLNLTVNSQPAILACSIAYLRALEQQTAGRLVPAFYAGHSMGQYSALVAAGVISLTDGVRLVRERGKQMQASAYPMTRSPLWKPPDAPLVSSRSPIAIRRARSW